MKKVNLDIMVRIAIKYRASVEDRMMMVEEVMGDDRYIDC